MKKRLADHGPKAPISEYHRPTYDEVKKLTDDYSFAADFNLASQLEHVYSSEDSVRQAAKDTHLGEQRKLLVALRDRCHAVEEVVSKLGTEERRRIDNVFPMQDLAPFQRDVHRLYQASQAAVLKMEKGKKQREENIWNFVYHLADVWQDGTEKPPTCGYDDIQGQYVGDFYAFVVQCARLGNIQLSKGKPGGTIVKILKEWRQRK
jgi:hypothetical protein